MSCTLLSFSLIKFLVSIAPGMRSIALFEYRLARCLASGAISPLGPEAELAGLILGGTLTAGSHLTKAGSRVLINTSPEPFSNWAASIGEDVAVSRWIMGRNAPSGFIYYRH